RLARLLAPAFFLIALVGSQPAFAASPVPSISDSRYFVGANVPWFTWACDFGCGSKNGVSSPSVRSAVADGFARLKAANVHTVRWWLFEGDPWQINHDGSGAPTGLNPLVYTDLDAAFALAEQYDLVYDLVLFSGPTSLPHAWIVDPTQRQRLADALAPMFSRY